MKPAAGTKCKFTAKLKKVPDGDAKFYIKFIEDLPPLTGAANLDNRTKTIANCHRWKDQLATQISDSKAEVQMDSTVPHDAWGKDNTAKEIYACIRAEYRFIGKGYRKIHSRINGSNGIDHLFVQGDDAVICESKTSSDFRH